MRARPEGIGRAVKDERIRIKGSESVKGLEGVQKSERVEEIEEGKVWTTPPVSPPKEEGGSNESSTVSLQTAGSQQISKEG